MTAPITLSLTRTALATAVLGWAIALSACSCPPNVASQRVQVSDPSGVPLNGANVTLQTGSEPIQTLVSSFDRDSGSGQGIYMGFGGIDPHGVTTLHIDAPGFRSVDRPLTADETRGAEICGRLSVNANVRLELP